jgi:hypothetical protein
MPFVITFFVVWPIASLLVALLLGAVLKPPPEP